MLKANIIDFRFLLKYNLSGAMIIDFVKLIIYKRSVDKLYSDTLKARIKSEFTGKLINYTLPVTYEEYIIVNKIGGKLFREIAYRIELEIDDVIPKSSSILRAINIRLLFVLTY